MDAYEIESLRLRLQAAKRPYLEFLRVPSLSVGVYHLFAGDIDPQRPHTEDEVYYLVSGQAMIRVGDEDRAVEPGSIVYVAANVEHRFHTITEDITALVFFAPAEYSLQPDQPT